MKTVCAVGAVVLILLAGAWLGARISAANAVAYYRLEGNVDDSVVGGSPGTLIAGGSGVYPTFSSDVPVSTVPETGDADEFSLHFDGSGSSLAFFGSSFPLNAPGDATVEFWFKVPAISAQESILWGHQDTTDCNRFNIYVNPDRTLGVDYREPVTCSLHTVLGPGTPGGSLSIEFDTWTHVAITRTFEGGDDVYDVYLNGVLARTQLDVAPHPPSNVGWSIGGRPGFAFTGNIDEVRFSDAALNANELLVNSPLPSAPTGLAAAPDGSFITLSWNGVSGADSYDVLRSTISGTGYTQIGTSTTASFTDTLVAPDVTYYYVVLAVNVQGTSGRSNEAFAKVSDTAPPLVNCTVPPGAGWYNTDVKVPCTASDSGSGLASGSDASFTLSTAGEGAALSTGNRNVCDAAGNCAQAGPFGPYQVDKTAPTLSPSVTPNPVVLQGTAVAVIGASDSLSGVASASCGTVDTSSVGVHTLTCTATDRAGNSNTATVSYVVSYGVCALYDQSKISKAGSVIPIKIELCDAAGGNVSSANVVVSAGMVAMVGGAPLGDPAQDAGNANPDSDFRFDTTLAPGGGYIYNLQTKGLVAGTYRVSISAAASPLAYSVQFAIK